MRMKKETRPDWNYNALSYEIKYQKSAIHCEMLNVAPIAAEVPPGVEAKMWKPAPEYLGGIVHTKDPSLAGSRHRSLFNCDRKISAPSAFSCARYKLTQGSLCESIQ